MKIAFAKTALLAALEQVNTVVPTSKSVPILTYVRLDASDGRLRLSATDLAVSISVDVSAGIKIKEDGVTLLPAAPFLAWLRTVDTGAVALTSTDEGLLVRVGSGAYGHSRVYPQPVDRFPTIPELSDAERHHLPRAALVAAMRLVRTAAATGAYSRRLAQVAVRAGKVVAADGIRYHEVDLPEAPLADLTLPLPFCDDLMRLVGSSELDTVDIGVPEDGQALVLRHGHVTLTSACRKEPYPDVAHTLLIPAMSNTQVLRVAREPLVDAVRRVRSMADPVTQAVTLAVPGFDRLEVHARQRNGAWASETLPAAWEGAPRELHFNHEHLLALLALFDTDTVNLRLGVDAKHKPSPLLISEGGRAGVLNQLRSDWHG